jgi:PAS domain S-box-containing protein
MKSFGRKTFRAKRSRLVRYGFALAAAAIATSVTSVVPALFAIPFALSFVAISATAWFAGFYPGLFCTAVSLLLVNIFVFPPKLALSSRTIVQSCVLAAVAVLICAVAREREQKEERLQKVENFFETTLRSVGDALIATDALGRVVFLNQVAERLTGWSLPEANGMSLGDVLKLSNTETGQPVLDPVAKVIEAGTVVGLANHTALTSRSGDLVQIEDSAAPIRDSFGKLLGVVMVFRDITQKYELDKKRVESERIFRELVESIAEGFESFDANWNFTYINHQGAAMTGNTPEALIGRNHWEAFPATVGTNFEKTIKAAAEEKKVTNITEFYPPLNKWFEVTAYPAQSGVSVLFQDVTEAVTAQERLRVADRLATAGRLAASVSHEINNPLEAIGNLLFLAKSTDSLEKTREYVSEAERQLYRVAHIAKQTLRFYKSTTERGEVLVSSAIRDAVGMFSTRLETRNVKLRQKIEEEVTVPVSHGELVQVIANVVSNAIDVAPPGSEILLEIARQQDAVIISVTDEGTGIPPEFQTKIFDPFFTTKTDFGTGLGLYVTKNIVEKHGGAITALNLDGGRTGAVFSVTLPLAKADSQICLIRTR